MMVAQSEKAVAQDPSNVAAIGIGAGGLAALGEEERARDWIDRATLIDPDNLVMLYNFACVLAAHLNDSDEAIKLLQRILTRCSVNQVRIAESDPDLDSLRQHPRFKKLMTDAKKRLGIADAVPTSGNELENS